MEHGQQQVRQRRRLAVVDMPSAGARPGAAARQHHGQVGVIVPIRVAEAAADADTASCRAAWPSPSGVAFSLSRKYANSDM